MTAEQKFASLGLLVMSAAGKDFEDIDGDNIKRQIIDLGILVAHGDGLGMPVDVAEYVKGNGPVGNA